jgi:hypothetical protein
MSSKDYISRKDAGFHAQQDNIHTQVTLHAAAWLIPEQSIAAFDNERRRWNSAYSTYLDPGKRTKAAVREKNDARKDYEAALRPFVQGQLMHNLKVTDSDRRNMNLPAYDRTYTLAAPPASYPELDIDFSQIGRHVLHVRDSELKGSGRPAHVVGFEIWRRIGGDTEPTLKEMHLVEQAPRSPHRLEYDFSERSQKVWYLLRWVNTRGVKGPWSGIVSAIIA